MKRPLVLVSLFIVSAAAVVLLVSSGWSRSVASTSAQHAVAELPVGPLGVRLAWPAGQQYRYRVELTASQRTTFPLANKPAMEMTATVDLVAGLTLRSHGVRDGVTILALSFTDVTRGALTILDQNGMPDASVLVGPEAFLEMTGDGHVAAVSFRPSTPDVFAHVVQGLVGELQVIVQPAAAWSTAQPTMFGRARVDYRITAQGAVERTRRTYESVQGVPVVELRDATQTIDGTGRAVIAEAGHVVSLDEQQSLKAVRKDGSVALDGALALHVKLVDVSTFLPEELSLAGLERRIPGKPTASKASARKHLEQRVAGLTGEQMITDLMSHLETGSLPNHEQWLWRAAALLELHPEVCADLVAVFESDEATQPARELVLDLLAQVGHAQAQKVLRDLLASPTAQASDAEFGLLLQRVSFVADPEPATVELLQSITRSATEAGKTDVRMASEYAIGSAVRNLSDGSDADKTLAATLEADLGRALDNAASPEEEAALVGAVANMPGQLPRLLPRVDHASASVRTQVAFSLGDRNVPEARAGLLAMLADRDVGVRTYAIIALDHHTLGAAELGQVAQLVAADKLEVTTDPELVTLLGKRLEQSPIAAQVLVAIRERNAHRNDLVSRINALLEAPPS